MLPNPPAPALAAGSGHPVPVEPTATTTEVVWHVVLDDEPGTTVAVRGPDRADAAPVDACAPDGWRRGIRARHVAEGARVWRASPCRCRHVIAEPVPACA